MKTGGLYGVVACSKTRVRCTFCGVFIPKAAKCIEQHTTGARHKENIILMNENGVTFANDALHCKPCKRTMPLEESVLKHIDSEEHSNWMAAADDLIDGEFISLDAYLSCEKDEAFCEVCNSHIFCSLQNLEEHVNNINHRMKIADRLKPLNGIFAVDNEDEVWCKVCNIFFDNNIRTILNHIDDDEQHMLWFTHIEDLIEDQEITIESFLSNEHELNAFCKKCHMSIFCTADNIESHVHSEAHLRQLDL